MNNKPSHAVVIGGSMAGMLAACVLSDHFDKVTLVERDHYPTQADYRNGVPQARHLHILLVRGMRILEKLFPGIDAELEAEGAKPMRWAWIRSDASRMVGSRSMFPTIKHALAAGQCSITPCVYIC